MSFSKIQYITSGYRTEEHYSNACRALASGITWIQLRIKNSTTNDILAIAEKIQQLKTQYTFTFIINDHPLLAKQIDADGVHLGLGDLSIAEARQILGDQKIIGGTANTLADVLQRTKESCDYIGLGPLRYTATKEKLSPILEYAGYAHIMEAIQRNKQVPPIFAIGGILPEDIVPISNMGIYGIALSKFLQDNFDQPSVIKQISSTL